MTKANVINKVLQGTAIEGKVFKAFAHSGTVIGEYLINSTLDSKKAGKATDFSCFPILAPDARLEPLTL
ncbi:hypothetical protein ACVW0P_002535 [Mucilaginibacter sp. UYNi724]